MQLIVQVPTGPCWPVFSGYADFGFLLLKVKPKQEPVRQEGAN